MNTLDDLSVSDYDKQVILINRTIRREVEKAWREIQLEADGINEERDNDAKTENEAPCVVCGSSSYILKYRNPVLSCRQCGNEKKVKMAYHKSSRDVLIDHMPSYSKYTNHIYQASEWLAGKGVEVANGLQEYVQPHYDCQNTLRMNDDVLKQVGLTRKYSYPPKPFMYSFKKLLMKFVPQLNL